MESEYLLAGAAAVYGGPVTGPVTVESLPLNTSGGPEADVLWGTIAPLIESRGDAWVGVTVRAGRVAG